MTQEELKEKVRKELNTYPTKSILNEDFDLIWDLYIESNQLKPEDLTPLNKKTEVGGFDLEDNMTKKELLEKIEKLPDDSYLFFDYEHNVCFTNAYVKHIENEEEVIQRLVRKLYIWSQNKIHLLKKENEMLKKQLNDLKNRYEK